MAGVSHFLSLLGWSLCSAGISHSLGKRVTITKLYWCQDSHVCTGRSSHNPLKIFQVSSSPRWMATFMTFELLSSMHFHKVQFYKRKVCLGFLGHPSMEQHRISQVSKSFLMVGFHLLSYRWWLFTSGGAAHCVCRAPECCSPRGWSSPQQPSTTWE